MSALKFSTESEYSFWCHQISRGLVFLAHPRLYRFHWIVSETVDNAHVCKVLLRQAFKYHNGCFVQQCRLGRPA
uniref:RxLR effector candidate protein n=1 Tax=Hyaloperonospora arabidopsidis (strain Emoy2) TaxID=559515 RepID=M4BW69_HYAAE